MLKTYRRGANTLCFLSPLRWHIRPCLYLCVWELTASRRKDGRSERWDDVTLSNCMAHRKKIREEAVGWLSCHSSLVWHKMWLIVPAFSSIDYRYVELDRLTIAFGCPEARRKASTTALGVAFLGPIITSPTRCFLWSLIDRFTYGFRMALVG